MPVHPHGCGERAASWLTVLALPPVHPHGCGERQALAVADVAAGGSSPRVWGTPPYARRSIYRQRFIPTGVGNARSCRLTESFERRFIPTGVGNATDFSGRNIERSRFIPTGVGNASCRSRLFVLVLRFIPTGVGNADITATTIGAYYGSSPRVWGTRYSSASK